MAKVWITYREGLRLLGAVVAEVPLEPTVAQLDLAPWRLFSVEPPEAVPAQQVEEATERKRALIEVTPTDRYDLCGLVVGLFESPYSPQECLRRLHVGSSLTVSA